MLPDIYTSLLILGLAASGCGLVIDLELRPVDAAGLDGGAPMDGAAGLVDGRALVDAPTTDAADAQSTIVDGAVSDAPSAATCDAPGVIACFTHECGADPTCEYDRVLGAVAIDADGSGMGGTRHSLAATYSTAIASAVVDVSVPITGTISVRLWVDASSLVLDPGDAVVVLAVHSVEGGWFEVGLRKHVEGTQVSALVMDQFGMQVGPTLVLPPGPQPIGAWFTPSRDSRSADGIVELEAGGMLASRTSIQAYTNIRRVSNVFVGSIRRAESERSGGAVLVDEVSVAVAP